MSLVVRPKQSRSAEAHSRPYHLLLTAQRVWHTSLLWLLQVSFFMARLRSAHDGAAPETNLDNDHHHAASTRVRLHESDALV